jgi:hypothetical protein
VNGAESFRAVDRPSAALRALETYVGPQGSLQTAATTESAHCRLASLEHPLAHDEVLEVMQDV